MTANLSNVNWVDRLLHEYSEGRKELRVKVNFLGDSEIDKIDKSKINSMINEMSEVIKWLKSGKDPYDFRGNDKRSAYQKRVLLDMDLFPSLDIIPDSFKDESPRGLTQEEKELVTNVLIELSWRERQCYLLHYANRRTFQEISDELGVTKSAVQSYMTRARGKVSEFISCHTEAI